METIAKLFTNGRSQAVRIPKAYQFDGVDRVLIRKQGAMRWSSFPPGRLGSPMPKRRLAWETISWPNTIGPT